MHLDLHLSLSYQRQCILLEPPQQVSLILRGSTPQRRTLQRQPLVQELHDVGIRW